MGTMSPFPLSSLRSPSPSAALYPLKKISVTRRFKKTKICPKYFGEKNVPAGLVKHSSPGLETFAKRGGAEVDLPDGARTERSTRACVEEPAKGPVRYARAARIRTGRPAVEVRAPAGRDGSRAGSSCDRL